MADTIVNKVAQSNLITLDLEAYYTPGPRNHLDIAPWLYEGVILKEKDFRAFVKEHAWENYTGALVSVHCSAEAIIPQWAYMLIGAALAPYAQRVVYGTPEVMETLLMDEVLAAADLNPLKDQRVILKGCGDLPIPPHAYLKIVSRLQPLVKSLMFGEACSTVPIYKRK